MNLLIVMYHYIDDEQKYKSGIYPVSPERLSDQLDKIGKIFDFIGEKELVAAIEKKAVLPGKSCLVTFDDGLRCQYEKAIPILESKGIPAIFSVNTMPLSQEKACVVHKVHYLLAQISPDSLLNEVKKYHFELTGQNLEIEKIFSGLRKQEGIYDEEPIFRLKLLINSWLDRNLSEKIINSIFKNFYGDESEFCRQWYMDKEQLLKIKESQLFSLGLHTASHIDFSALAKNEIAVDITDNFNYFKDELLMEAVSGISYPYGLISEAEINEKIKPTVVGFGIKYGLTTHKGINDNLNNPLFLKRFDANDVVGGKKPIISF